MCPGNSNGFAKNPSNLQRIVLDKENKGCVRLPQSEHEVTNFFASCEPLCEECGEVSVTNLKPIFPGEKLTRKFATKESTTYFLRVLCATFSFVKEFPRFDRLMSAKIG